MKTMKRTVAVVGCVVALMALIVSMAVRLGRDAPFARSPSADDEAAGATDAPLATAAQATGDATRITMADFLPLHDDRRVLVIDVRRDSAFRDGHIPGAINIGAEAVKDRVTEILVLAAGRPIVTYCACVNEHSSAVAAVRLTEAGAPDVRALVGGYTAWVAEGGPVAKGDGSGE